MDNDKLKICVKSDTMSLAPSLMNLGDNRSNPVAVLEFSLHKNTDYVVLTDFIKTEAITCYTQ